MALTRKGTSGWFLAEGGELQTDRFGMSQATATYERLDVATNVNPGQPVAFGQLHPIWTFLTCDRFSIRANGAGWICQASFFGVTGTPTPIYELDFSTSEEPIETHRKFVSDLGGKPGSELNGARFDDDGAFIGFTGPFSSDSEEQKWRGVQSYLSPGTVWRKNYTTATRPADVGSIGKIDAAPEGTPPTVPVGFTWLYTGLTWEQRGLVYTVKKEWRLSGRNGWNSTIYDTAY